MSYSYYSTPPSTARHADDVPDAPVKMHCPSKYDNMPDDYVPDIVAELVAASELPYYDNPKGDLLPKPILRRTDSRSDYDQGTLERSDDEKFASLVETWSVIITAMGTDKNSDQGTISKFETDFSGFTNERFSDVVKNLRKQLLHSGTE